VSKVTVVIALYNKEKTVARTVESIRAQTFSDWRLIVVDDGSTDSGPEIVRNFADDRIELIQQSNKGPGAARNAGIALAESKYIAFLDADDEWYPWCLANAIKAMEENDVALVASMYHVWPWKTDKSEFLQQNDIEIGVHSVVGNESPEKVRRMAGCVKTINIVLKTEVARKYDGFYAKDKCTFGEDVVFLMRVILNERFMFIAPAAVRYHAESSDLDRNWGKPHAKPLPPYLDDPELIAAYCSENTRGLCLSIIHLRLFSKIDEWAFNGRKIRAMKLLKKHPELKAYKQRYRKCFLRVLFGSSILDNLRESLKEICKSTFWAVKRFLKRKLRPSLQRDILFVCQSRLSADRLHGIFTLLKDNKNLRLSLLDMSSKWSSESSDSQQYIKSKLPIQTIESKWTARMNWDLIVTADHSNSSLVDKKKAPSLYVSGETDSELDFVGSQGAFSDFAMDQNDNCRYSRIIVASEEEKDRAIKDNPVFAGIAVAGDLRGDRVLAEIYSLLKLPLKGLSNE
jgi:glycosyltransferase involved in cell wall biosynthesis